MVQNTIWKYVSFTLKPLIFNIFAIFLAFINISSILVAFACFLRLGTHHRPKLQCMRSPNNSFFKNIT